MLFQKEKSQLCVCVYFALPEGNAKGVEFREKKRGEPQMLFLLDFLKMGFRAKGLYPRIKHKPTKLV